MMFASILISGIQLITKHPIGSREITIISVAIGLGYGLGATTGATAHLPYYVQLIFGRFRNRTMFSGSDHFKYRSAERIQTGS